ncbi:MAG TPA: carboxypeptidase regulatory-like domain-containing protein [Opitutaceae bacterium]|nr:carboxypeptidase regulatory-like domain-containing protein [Opitutaceae bacterium]
MQFSIPEQPVASALQAFIRQSDAQVMFNRDEVGSARANAVVGTYEPEAAIASLLTGSGFKSVRTPAGVFLVTRSEPKAQAGSVRGKVMAQAGGRPVADATIGVEGEPPEARSGRDGLFILRDVAAGTRTLIVRADGYRTARVTGIAVRAGHQVDLNPVQLASARSGDTAEQLEGVTVSATDLTSLLTLQKVVVTPSRFDIAEERLASNVVLTGEELEKLPQLGEDLYRTIARLPGLSAHDFSAKFWVRGAPNNQMLARFDGVDLIEPFHLKDFDGILSIVDLQTIGSVGLVTGGFTSDYGDRLAGVLTMETQEDTGTANRTTLGLSVTNVRATNQGSFDDGRGHWLAAARRGYLDLALKLGGSDVDVSPFYYDFSGKVDYELAPRQVLSLHVLYAGDSFKALNSADVPDLRSSYRSGYVWAGWRGEFGEKLSGESVLSFSRLDWHRAGNGLFDGYQPLNLRDDRQLDVWGLRQDWTLNLTPQALIRTGFEYKAGDASYDYALSRQLATITNGNLLPVFRTRNAALKPDGTTQAVYLAPRFQPWTPLVIEPGVRFERHTYSGLYPGESTWSPRLNASLAFGRTTLRAAWGIYRQAQGLHELSVQDNETTYRPPERAEQRVLGISRKLESGVELRLEGYERLSSHLRPHWENVVDPFSAFPEALYDRVRLNPTQGRARGVELITEQRGGGRFEWGASYAYAVSEEQIGARWVPRNRDQRHTFYADATYAPSPKWQFSAAWQFHTGWPVTDQIFKLEPLNNGTATYSWVYGPVNAQRTPAYHRLDLRATRVYRLRRGSLRVYADIFNAYSHANVDGYDHTAAIVNGQLVVKKEPLTMFPFLPSAGVSWEF